MELRVPEGPAAGVRIHLGSHMYTDELCCKELVYSNGTKDTASYMTVPYDRITMALNQFELLQDSHL